VKRTGRDESIGVVIYIHTQHKETPLCSFLYLKLAKCHVSFFIFCVFLLENWRIGEHNSFGGRVGTGRVQEVAGKGVGV
jgi:hypothetical protein